MSSANPKRIHGGSICHEPPPVLVWVRDDGVGLKALLALQHCGSHCFVAECVIQYEAFVGLL